jgi:hypothetical protein
MAARAFVPDANLRRCAWRDRIGRRLPLENLLDEPAEQLRLTGLREIRACAEWEQVPALSLA